MRIPRLLSLILLLSALSSAFAAAQWTPKSVVAIEGRFVTLEPEGSAREVFEGTLLIRDGRIESLLAKGAALPDGCLVVKTEGFVYPGLINLHDHMTYNFLSLYDLPEHAENSHDWPQGDAYLGKVNNPRVAVTHSKFFNYMDEALKFAEVRAIVGGSTAVQGAPGSPAIKSTLVRNVDHANFGRDDVGQSALTMNVRFAEKLGTEVPKVKQLQAWIMHLSEGIDDYARNQWSDPGFDPSKPFDELPTTRNLPGLVEADLVFPGLVGVHCTGMHKEDFEQWRAITGEGPKVVWSPASNLLLYGKTTNVADVLAADGLIALGTDWAPSGSKNLLWELKVADQVNKQSSPPPFSDRGLVELVTVNPAKMLGWEADAGRIREGLVADLLILDAIDADPYRNLIQAREEHVQLVFVGGNPLYGDEAQLAELKVYEGTPQYELLPETAGSRPKAIDMLEDPDVRSGDLSLAEVRARLEQAVSLDPEALAKIFNAGVQKTKTKVEYKARIAMLQALEAEAMKAKGETPPEYPQDLDVTDREVTPDEVATYIKLSFPTMEPLPGIDPLFTDARFFDAWERNVHFQPAPPFDLRAYAESKPAQVGISGSLEPSADADFLSSREAATRLGVTTATVSRWARDGEIPGAVKEGGSWKIPAAWVETKAAGD
ncbi:MAG: amidohydrolase family protein [Planctomycetes bacterium]|nr:amidohydrolase family protein [Planctomycetota bacterium]